MVDSVFLSFIPILDCYVTIHFTSLLLTSLHCIPRTLTVTVIVNIAIVVAVTIIVTITVNLVIVIVLVLGLVLVLVLVLLLLTLKVKGCSQYIRCSSLVFDAIYNYQLLCTIRFAMAFPLEPLRPLHLPISLVLPHLSSIPSTSTSSYPSCALS